MQGFDSDNGSEFINDRRLCAQLRTLNPIELKRKIVDIQKRVEVIALAKAKVKQFSNPPSRKALGTGKRQ